MSKIRAAVVGASGYSGEELCRLLLRHPGVELTIVTSRQSAGASLVDVFPRLHMHKAAADLHFTQPSLQSLLESDAQAFFLALPHGAAAEYAVPLHEAGRTVIDISADFRLRSADVYYEFYEHSHPAPELLGEAVYGLPELKREEIRSAQLIACPGCYPTSILLPLVPLVKNGLIDPASIVVASSSGVSGAGRKADIPLLFVECNESLRAYGLPKHRHLSEIEQELSLLHGNKVTITFVPHLAPLSRGMHTLIIANPSPGTKTDAIRAALDSFYAEEPFVRVIDGLPDTKNVAGTNFCEIGMRVDERTGRILLLSAIDNLGKGAAGQAVQNFNIRYGLPETMGLLDA